MQMSQKLSVPPLTGGLGWPNYWKFVSQRTELRTLDPAGMKDTIRDWLPISKANVRCIQKLLNHMAERDGITSSYKDSEVRWLISKVSKYNRNKMDFEELSEEDKKIQEGRKEKAKQLRQQRQEKKEEKKKRDEEKYKKKEEKAKKRQTDEDAMDKSGSDIEKSVKLN